MKNISNLIYIVLLLLVVIIGLSVFVSAGTSMDGTDTNDQNNIGLPGDGDEGNKNDGTGGSNNSGNASGNGSTGTSSNQLGFVEKKLLAANEGLPKFVGKCNGCVLKTDISTKGVVFHTFSVHCEVCGTIDSISQEHNNLVRYEPVDENTHYEYYYCTVCEFERKLHLSHEIGENGVCPCEVSCEHNNLKGSCTVIDKTTHKISGRCSDCGKTVEKTEEHKMVDGVCSKCSFECEHKDTSMIFEAGSNGNAHTVTTACKDCDYYTLVILKHVYDDRGICKMCDYKCGHGGKKAVVTNISSELHRVEFSCDICGFENNYEGSHLILEDGTCGMKDFGCNLQHTHDVVFVPDTSNFLTIAEGHGIREMCSLCGRTLNGNGFEAHSFGSDSVCVVCGYECVHDDILGSGVCRYCGRYDCDHEYENGICTKCKHECANHLVIGDEENGFYCAYCDKKLS